MSRARAQLICTRPENYTPARVREAVAYELGATEDERRQRLKRWSGCGAGRTNRARRPRSRRRASRSGREGVMSPHMEKLIHTKFERAKRITVANQGVAYR
jgi:hypothetical protein